MFFTPILRKRLGAAAIVAALLGAVGPPRDARASVPLVVYVSPSGTDASDGSAPSTAVKTPGRAQEILDRLRGDQAAEVRLAGGTYPVSGLNWHHYRAGRTTVIRGSGVGGQARLDAGGRAVALVIRPRTTASVRLIVADVKMVRANNGVRLVGAADVAVKRVTFYLIGRRHAAAGGSPPWVCIRQTGSA